MVKVIHSCASALKTLQKVVVAVGKNSRDIDLLIIFFCWFVFLRGGHQTLTSDALGVLPGGRK